MSYPFVIQGSDTQVETHALIIATGATAKRLDIEGARDGEFWQKGVTACAVCDGAAPIFRNKPLYVIGGGDSAVEEATFLTRFAEKVYLIHRRDALRASKIMIERAEKDPKLEFVWNSQVVDVLGDEQVSAVRLRNTVDGTESELAVTGLFVAIGHDPRNELIKGIVDLDDAGYVTVQGRSTATNIDGVFAAGDLVDHTYRQAITAAGSGCAAALDAERWLAHAEH